MGHRWCARHCVCGPLQAWLCDVEKTMRWTLKEVLKNCRLALKKSLTRRDKWTKDWPGQVSITWTMFYNVLGCMWERQCYECMQSVRQEWPNVKHVCTSMHTHTHTSTRASASFCRTGILPVRLLFKVIKRAFFHALLGTPELIFQCGFLRPQHMFLDLVSIPAWVGVFSSHRSKQALICSTAEHTSN